MSELTKALGFLLLNDKLMSTGLPTPADIWEHFGPKSN